MILLRPDMNFHVGDWGFILGFLVPALKINMPESLGKLMEKEISQLKKLEEQWGGNFG